MRTQSDVVLLKEQFEQLFPGKWLVNSRTQRNIPTGIAEIDFGITQGLVRRQITEWMGPPSSGKTTFLRSIVALWCASGMQVVYVDTFDRLRSHDWAFVERGDSGAVPLNIVSHAVKHPGKFLVVRNLKGGKLVSNAFWAVEQLIRSAIFDLVIFDLANNIFLSSKMYARLQRCLENSRTVLILLKDGCDHPTIWGCDSRFSFGWSSTVHCELGLFGTVSIIPAIDASLCKSGMTKNIEVNIQSHVSNCLFTHPQVPDRRTSKK